VVQELAFYDADVVCLQVCNGSDGTTAGCGLACHPWVTCASCWWYVGDAWVMRG
jgi:hypothetical protein